MTVEPGMRFTDPDGHEWTVKDVLPKGYVILARMVEATHAVHDDEFGERCRYRPVGEARGDEWQTGLLNYGIPRM